jgi:hypothetical protein
LALGSWLLANGVSGAFGILGANAGEIVNQSQQGGVNLPSRAATITAQQARDIAASTARVGWSFTIGSLLGLAASLIGAAIGARTPRRYVD